MKRQLAALLLAALPAALASPAATLSERIEQILRRPAARRAFWGIQVLDLESGRTPYQLNAGRLFVPASNTKLFTTALALSRLGPEYRYLTRLATDTPPDAEGRMAGDLALVGGGDPNFSSRVIPYEKRVEFRPNRLEPIEELAEEAAALGVRRIDGDIVGDDTRYLWERWADTWALEDIGNGDGPPVTALAFNDNVVALRIRPGGIEIHPSSSFYDIDDRRRGQAGARLRVERQPGQRTIQVWGNAGVARTEAVAIDDPALFAALALREALERRGIAVAGSPRARHAMPFEPEPPPDVYPFTLASRSSFPLIEDLRLINKISQNLHAELALRAVARERRGVGSWEASRAELGVFLQQAGISAEEYSFQDGSGLSRRNLVSPSAVVALLAYMWRSPLRDTWLETLPVAGVDGTLRARFVSTPAAERLQAKTGTLSHVSALSGYLETGGGRRLAFAILVNNYGAQAAPVRAAMDQICVALIQ